MGGTFGGSKLLLGHIPRGSAVKVPSIKRLREGDSHKKQNCKKKSHLFPALSSKVWH